MTRHDYFTQLSSQLYGQLCQVMIMLHPTTIYPTQLRSCRCVSGCLPYAESRTQHDSKNSKWVYLREMDIRGLRGAVAKLRLHTQLNNSTVHDDPFAKDVLALDENENESSCQYPVRAGMHPAVEHQYQAEQAANKVRGRGSGGSGGFRKLLQGLGSGYQNDTCPKRTV